MAQKKDEGQPAITRRSIAPLAVGSLIGAWLTKNTAGAAPAVGRNPALMELPLGQARAYVQKLLTSNKKLATLKEHFDRQGYDFVLERVKVFVLAKGPGVEKSYSVALLPSLVTAKRADPSHSAVTIVADSLGIAFAGGATIQHNPFQITEFRVFDLAQGNSVSVNSISSKELAAISPQKAADLLGAVKGDGPGVQLSEEAAAKNEILASTLFREWINDRFAKPLYPEEGLRALLGQGPLTDKFAAAVALRLSKGGVGGLCAAGVPIFLCSSCSSNACTSSSVIFTSK